MRRISLLKIPIFLGSQLHADGGNHRAGCQKATCGGVARGQGIFRETDELALLRQLTTE